MNPEDVSRHRAASEMQAAIRRAAVDQFGAIESHEPIDGYQTLTRPVLDDPLTGLRAALLASRVACGEMREYAEQARSTGRSWDDVAAALELGAPDPGKPGPVPGEIAFEWLIEGRDPAGDHGPHWTSRATARWACSACGARVTDRGPFEPHPDDNESGHEPDCGRRTAAVRAFQRERGGL